MPLQVWSNLDIDNDMPAPKCHSCKKTIRGPKMVINELWTCQECVYYLEKGLIPPGAERDKAK